VSKLFHTKEHLTIAQLTAAWAVELAEVGEDPSRCTQDLAHILMEDIVNGRLDNSGSLSEGRRLGVALITPEHKAGFLEGRQLHDLFRTSQNWVPHYVLIMKEAALDFARRHRLPPPSWWTDSEETPTPSPNDTTSDVIAESAEEPLPSLGKQPRIAKYLMEHFPEGVPCPGIRPRKDLRQAILKWDPTLGPLDEATLKKAIDKHNADLTKQKADPK
jgi:hypothetical protein